MGPPDFPVSLLCVWVRAQEGNGPCHWPSAIGQVHPSRHLNGGFWALGCPLAGNGGKSTAMCQKVFEPSASQAGGGGAGEQSCALERPHARGAWHHFDRHCLLEASVHSSTSNSRAALLPGRGVVVCACVKMTHTALRGVWGGLELLLCFTFCQG